VTARTAQRLLRIVSIGLLFAIAMEVHRRGSIRRGPSSVISNTYFPLRASEPFLLFLRAVAERIPDGDRVVVLAGEEPLLGSGDVGPRYLFGVSQLGRQVVLPESALESSAASGPLWVAAFGRTFADPRFRMVAEFRGGSLFRKSP